MKRTIWLLLLAACSSGPDPDINSPYPYGRYLGALELGDRHSPENVTTLLKLLDDPEYLVRSGAVTGLARMNKPELSRHIVPKLDPEKETVAMVRSDACLALGTLKHPESIPALLAALQSDPENVVRRDAAKALVPFGKKPEILPALAKAVDDPDVSVAWRAHVSLVELTGAKTVERTAAAWEAWLKDHP
jgi:HEAT repeat protein